MKKMIYVLAGLSAVVMVAFMLTSPVTASGSAHAVLTSKSVFTNDTQLVAANDSRIGLCIYNSSGAVTVRVGFVTGTYAQHPLSILPGATLVFPSSTADFVPKTAVFCIQNNGAVTNTIVTSDVRD